MPLFFKFIFIYHRLSDKDLAKNLAKNKNKMMNCEVIFWLGNLLFWCIKNVNPIVASQSSNSFTRISRCKISRCFETSDINSFFVVQFFDLSLFTFVGIFRQVVVVQLDSTAALTVGAENKCSKNKNLKWTWNQLPLKMVNNIFTLKHKLLPAS